ncbi:MAG: NUDIX hydrolase [Armatimonadetes bacterium]|nr:NUDIX hydrolase [Armatimonadota bacterium]
MDFTEKVLQSERIYEGRVVSLRVDTVELPDGNRSSREIVEHRGAVAIVPILPDGKVVLVRQFRLAAGQSLLEIPAGTLDPGESPEACAARELEEEIGYRLGQLEKVSISFLAPGYSSELLHCYLATGLEPVPNRLDADEFLEPVPIPLDEAIAMIGRQEIKDAKTLYGLLLAHYKLEYEGKDR